MSINYVKIVQDHDHPPLLCHLCRLLGGRFLISDSNHLLHKRPDQPNLTHLSIKFKLFSLHRSTELHSTNLSWPLLLVLLLHKVKLVLFLEKYHLCIKFHFSHFRFVKFLTNLSWHLILVIFANLNDFSLGDKNSWYLATDDSVCRKPKWVICIVIVTWLKVI